MTPPPRASAAYATVIAVGGVGTWFTTGNAAASVLMLGFAFFVLVLAFLDVQRRT